ncbi:sulfotransferase family protein [Falsihalocynthiibacter sp. BN13B15]
MTNYQACMQRSVLAQSIVYEASHDVIYMNNAKAGCSTIKSTLIKSALQEKGLYKGEKLDPKLVHGANQIWCKDFSRISDKNTFSFSVVRNPFTRTLSAFLDKMRLENILKKQFFWQHDLDPQQNLTFLGFLRLLKNSDSLFDQHWRPQIANLYAGYLPIHETHFLESFDKTQGSICDRLDGVSLFLNRSPHGTDARKKVSEFICDEAHEIIVDLYKEDFKTFGYSTEIMNVNDAPGGILELPAETPILTDMLAHMNGKYSKVDDLKLSLHALGFVELGENGDPRGMHGWQDKVIKTTTSGVAANKYLALSIVSDAGNQHFDPEFVVQCLFDIVQMAPYQIGNHTTLARHLASIGKHDQAQNVLDTLLPMTWQKDMVTALKNKLWSLREPQ